MCKLFLVFGPAKTCNRLDLDHGSWFADTCSIELYKVRGKIVDHQNLNP